MKKITLTKIILALLGILFIGIGVAFNAANQLGNDPIGIIYDGIRNTLGLTVGQLGTVSNLVNISLILLLLIIGRRYINLGTLIYILPYGIFINLGTMLYHSMNITGMPGRIVAAIIGCLLIYIGVAIFISVDIGLDPFTGIVMVLRDKLKLDYKKVKIGFDLTMIVLGTLLGGKLGVITVITALSAGPTIQWFSGKFSSLIENLDRKNTQECCD